MGRGTLGEVQDGSGTLGEVQEGSEDNRGGPGQVLGLSGRSRTGWETLKEIREGWGTLGEVRDG